MKKLIVLAALGLLGSIAAAKTNITVTIERVAGVPRIAINGQPRAGVCAVPNCGTPAEIQFGLRDFAKMGVEFYSTILFSTGKRNDWWLGEGKYDFAALDRYITTILDIAKDGYIFPRIKCEPPEWWAKAHPSEMRAGHGNPKSLVWRALITRMYTDVVRHMEESDYAHHILGYHLAGLGSSEWEIYPWPKEEQPDTLGDPRDPFPPFENFSACRDYVIERNDAVADTLLAAAKATKEACGGRKLVGAFFGYLVSQDHRAFSRVVDSGLIDFICAPGNYHDRRIGEPASFQTVYLGSLRLHNRLYWDEADIRTWLAPWKYEPAIACDYYCHSKYETVNVLKRNSGFALTGGIENWWFLLAGNQTFHDELILSPIRMAFAEERATLAEEPATRAKVAVFTSAEEFLTSCYAKSQELAEQVKWNFHQRTLRRVGVEFDCYELADIEHPALPDYDVYIFPNAFTLSEQRRETIKRIVRRKGKTAIWMIAPGYYRNGKGAVENVTDLIGLTMHEHYPIANGPVSRQLEVVGATGSNFVFAGEWRSIFFPSDPALVDLRAALRSAGVHVWSDSNDVVSVGRGYVMLHASSDGVKHLSLDGTYDVREVFAQSPDLKAATGITENLRLGETRIYHLTPAKQ